MIVADGLKNPLAELKLDIQGIRKCQQLRVFCVVFEKSQIEVDSIVLALC